MPVVLLVIESFTGPQGLTLDGYRKVLADDYYVGIIWNSIKLALITTLATLIDRLSGGVRARARKGRTAGGAVRAGLPAAHRQHHRQDFGISIMMGRDGIINWLLVNLGFIERPIRLVFTEFNLYFGMVNVFLPFMILPLYSVDAHARSAPHRCRGLARRGPGLHLLPASRCR